MTLITIEKLSDVAYDALVAQAAKSGCTIEDEVCHILEKALQTEHSVKLGSRLSAIGQALGGVDLAITRDATPTEPN